MPGSSGITTEKKEAERNQPAGLRAFAARSAARTGTYSFERTRPTALDAPQQDKLRGNARAWRFSSARAPWYQRTALHWVTSAKREATRERRLATLIADSAAGRTIRPLTRPAK